MRFILITNEPQRAADAVKAGVDLVMLDLEVLGKADRQGHVDSWKSHHRLEELPNLRAALPSGTLMTRINPLHPGSAEEIDAVVAAGSDWIMVPMFRTPEELKQVQSLIAGRAKLMPLVETVGALESAQDWAALSPDGVHIGLNDLHLELGARFMFEPLADDTLTHACSVFQRHRIPFGIGGIARVGEGAVPAELVLSRHVDLGSDAAILSRTFQRSGSGADLASDLARLREVYALHQASTAQIRADHRARLHQAVAQVAAQRS